MTRYSVHPRDQIFVKGYGLLSFAKNMSKYIGKNICKSLSDKYSPGMLARTAKFSVCMRQKLLDHAKQSA